MAQNPPKIMDVEDKLDEDFLFYLGFISSFIQKLQAPEQRDAANVWLQKLCGEKCETVDRKRNRNIFLSNLVLCMQEGRLSPPFNQGPNEVDLGNAATYFGQAKVEVQQPDWFQEVVGDDDGTRKPKAREDGRTYVATRTLPGGEGAFAYVAITMAEEEPRWLGGGEGAFHAKMEEKFAEYVPPQTEMEKILARRKDPKEREKVLTFYDVLMKNIASELDDEVPAGENETISGLLEQLTNDLKEKGEWAKYEDMNENQRRIELLLMLYDRINDRRKKTAKREEMLDDIEEKLMPKSFWETSVQPDDKFELPSAMWEQAINKAPTKKHMEILQAHYPLGVIEKFLEYLSNYKEALAMRLQRRHEHIVSQMKKELRKEGVKGGKRMEEAQTSCDQALSVLKAVRAAKANQLESQKAIKPKKKGGVTGKTRLYDEMRQALLDTQRNVEEEAQKGLFLSEQINAISEQSEIYQHVNDESILKTEEANMATMKNIKRLQLAVRQYEGRLAQLQAMKEQKPAKETTQKFFFF